MICDANIKTDSDQSQCSYYMGTEREVGPFVYLESILAIQMMYITMYYIIFSWVLLVFFMWPPGYHGTKDLKLGT